MTDQKDESETVTPQEAKQRLRRIKEAYDREQRRDFGEDRDVDMCELCTVVEADRRELVQAEESNREMEVLLCESCWEKTERYENGEDVDFEEELRLHD